MVALHKPGEGQDLTCILPKADPLGFPGFLGGCLPMPQDQGISRRR